MGVHNFKKDTTHIYHDFEDGRFFINTPACILSDKQIVQTNKVYLFSDMLDEPQRNIMVVKLLNVHYDEGSVCLHLMDYLIGNVFDVSQVVIPNGENCLWMLIDMDFIIEKLIKKEIDPTIVGDNLLEFEF